MYQALKLMTDTKYKTYIISELIQKLKTVKNRSSDHSLKLTTNMK
jgi:hypothetical protein